MALARELGLQIGKPNPAEHDINHAVVDKCFEEVIDAFRKKYIDGSVFIEGDVVQAYGDQGLNVEARE